jgi:hypothetical protein
MERRIIIGAIGGGVEPTAIGDVKAFGGAVAEAGCILLTGGPPPEATGHSSRVEPAVKNVTMLGSVEAAAVRKPAVISRLIGILPSSDVSQSEPPGRLALRTGLDHTQRNAINGLTPDVMVVFGGSTGTLSELGFAAAAGKPILFFPRSLTMLRQKYDEHTADGEIDRYFQMALRVYPEPAGVRQNVAGLTDLLSKVLAHATDDETDVSALVAQAVSLATGSGPPGSTGFPDLPNVASSKERFESAVRRLSLSGSESRPE